MTASAIWSPASMPLASQAELVARYIYGDPTVSISVETITDYVPTRLDAYDTRSLGEWLLRQADSMDRRYA